MINFHRFLLTLTTKGFWRKNEKDITYVESAIFYYRGLGSDSNLLIVFYVQIMPDDLVMQLHRF